MRNICHTLAYNLPGEVLKTTKLLYEQNARSDFEHIIIDLGFPMEDIDVIPRDFDEAKRRNSARLKEICNRFGSAYARRENIGVSQNWTQAYNMVAPLDDWDVLIGTDPDEHPLNPGWVKAMCDTMRIQELDIVALSVPGQNEYIEGKLKCNAKMAGTTRVYVPDDPVNWALIGISGRLLKNMGYVPFPSAARRYGWIEGALLSAMDHFEMRWGVLPDYSCNHTIWHMGDPIPLFQQWKYYIVNNVGKQAQISFEEFLEMKKKEGRI
ncbi:MAG TPA: hypothetical protein PK727_04720 [Bacteroidales bacterium]|nr:hypothetical protein [Bacteroidales bacterium]HOG56612.1 hypothetical protein [Bacteroidales bacterium]